MLAASHRACSGFVHVNYESLTDAAAWVQVLLSHQIDVVVNCVGIWSGTSAYFELVQFTVPVALFDACSQLGLRVVHVSALGFDVDSPLPYVATKARADRYLLQNCPSGVVIYPSLVFGPAGRSSRFFLGLAALPVQVDFGYERNLQPVHVQDVAATILSAVRHPSPARSLACAGTHVVAIPEYFDALRKGMGLPTPWLSIRVPRWCGKALFIAGQALGRHFVNRQSWALLESGTHADASNPHARPYESFAGETELADVQLSQLYWGARLSMAVLWLWTAVVTWFFWPQQETLAWLDALFPGLGTIPWLAGSCVLDAAMGLAALFAPSRQLWRAQFWLTAAYSIGLAFALPWSVVHPFGLLTKNLTVMVTALFLLQREGRRA